MNFLKYAQLFAMQPNLPALMSMFSVMSNNQNWQSAQAPESRKLPTQQDTTQQSQQLPGLGASFTARNPTPPDTAPKNPPVPQPGQIFTGTNSFNKDHEPNAWQAALTKDWWAS